MIKIVIAYFIIINCVGITVMGVDKSRAVHHGWRIPEKTLFFVSIMGGSIGTWLGMYLFRHKTRHWYFVVGMPLILLMQAAAMVFYYCHFVRI